MRPFQQADPNVQMTLVDRGNRPPQPRPPSCRRSSRRPPLGDVRCARRLAFTRLFPFVPIARTDIERNRGRTA